MESLNLDSVKSFVDTLWVIDCAILVFIMQAGFMCMETGLSRNKNNINVALKNAADFGLAVVVFWIFGFGSLKIIEDNFNTDSGKQLSDISNAVISTAGDSNLSDDLTLISIGK